MTPEQIIDVADQLCVDALVLIEKLERDVERIVYCKDCIWAKKDSRDTQGYICASTMGLEIRIFDGDHFCSLGRRKNDT